MSKHFSFNEAFGACKQHGQSPVDIIDPLAPDKVEQLFSAMADLLTPVFLFLSKARSRETAGDRQWVVLYVVKPDLLGNETVASYAKRCGLRETQVWNLVAEFRAAIPRFRYGRVQPSTRTTPP